MALPEFLLDRYRDWKRTIDPLDKKFYLELEKNTQEPKLMIISCCDSRVNVSNIFKADPGDYFVHRNIANLIPTYNSKEENYGTISAIEYGIKILKIPQIVILGHSKCGGINYAYKKFSGSESIRSSSIDKWIKFVEPAYKQLNKNQNEEKSISDLEKLSIKNSISNLLKYPNFEKLHEENKLQIHGLWFEIGTGDLFEYNQIKNTFDKIIV